MKTLWIYWNKYKFLLKELVGRDLKVKYRRSALGYLWSLLNPLLMMLVISMIFSHIFRFDIANYPIYLLTGQILFSFFNEATTISMRAIIDNSILLKKVYIPKYIFPLARVLSSFVTLGFSMIAILIMMLISRIPITINIIFVLIPLAHLLVFSLGVGFVVSALTVYFRDVLHLYTVLLTAWMYWTPIFYPITQLPSYMQKIVQFNPLYPILDTFRAIVLNGQIPMLNNVIYCTGVSFASLCIGAIIFRLLQKNFILHI